MITASVTAFAAAASDWLTSVPTASRVPVVMPVVLMHAVGTSPSLTSAASEPSVGAWPTCEFGTSPSVTSAALTISADGATAAVGLGFAVGGTIEDPPHPAMRTARSPPAHGLAVRPTTFLPAFDPDRIVPWLAQPGAAGNLGAAGSVSRPPMHT